MYEQKNSFNIIGIDPGTNMLGFSVYRLHPETFEILSIIPISVNISNKESNTKWTDNVIFRLLRLRRVTKQIIKKYNPHIVTIESGFINKLRPGAFGPLSKALMVLEGTVKEVDETIKVFKFPPSIIKKAVNSKMYVNKNSKTSIKDEMSLAINAIEEVRTLFNPFLYTEHVVDSVAINYSMLLEIRRTQGLIVWV